MTAVRIRAHGGPQVLETVRVPVPVPEAGEALVEVRAAVLNNTDLWPRPGAYGTAGDPDALAGWRGPIEFPRIQGADVAGVVVSVGPGTGTELVGLKGGGRPRDRRRGNARTRTRSV